jgi:hypothetical protein
MALYFIQICLSYKKSWSYVPGRTKVHNECSAARQHRQFSLRPDRQRLSEWKVTTHTRLTSISTAYGGLRPWLHHHGDHDRVHRIPLFVPVPSQPNPVQYLLPCFHTTLQVMPRFSKTVSSFYVLRLHFCTHFPSSYHVLRVTGICVYII